MLNLFPTFLVFGLLAPFLIRIAVAVYFLIASTSDIKRLYSKKDGQKSYGILVYFIASGSFVSGILMFVGLYTQMAAIFLAATSLSYAIREPQKRALYLLLFAMSLSLLFSGAGFFAFDLPL